MWKKHKVLRKKEGEVAADEAAEAGGRWRSYVQGLRARTWTSTCRSKIVAEDREVVCSDRE